ncbi:hypothetical protein CF161_02931 [Pseudomonas sp. CF161]|nr:hypothetical protein CF161_02931 [Pseudomonas sp. CF161]
MVLFWRRHIKMAVKQRQCSQAAAFGRSTVVTALQTDELLLLRLTYRIEIIANQTNGGIDRVRSTLTENDAIQTLGRQCGQPRCQSNGGLTGEVKIAGGVGQFFQLFFRSVYDGLLAITRVDTPKPRKRILHAFTVNVGEVDPFR